MTLRSGEFARHRYSWRNRTAHSRAASSWSFALSPSANRLVSAGGSSARSFGYDTLGNLASYSQGAKTFGYDAFNRTASFYGKRSINRALAADDKSARQLSHCV